MTDDYYPPQINDAPGLVWKRRTNEWVATWQARSDLAKRGFLPKTVPLWRGAQPDDMDRARIQDQCNRLQADMLIWGRGGLPDGPTKFDGTLKSLAECYQTDEDSNFPKLQFKTRDYYCSLMKRIITDHGNEHVRDIKARMLLRWHEDWNRRGVSLAHGVIGMLRTLINFGAVFLEDKECERLSGILHKMKFKQAKPRTQQLTAEQAIAIRREAHHYGLPSIALAQAFQFDCMLRQKDCIGEWMPQAEPGLSDTLAGGDKWLKGLRWEEIDQNMILRHTTSKRQKDIEVNLMLAPMVMEELALIEDRPTRGPIVVSEYTGRPWVTHHFRRRWRMVADAAGVPKTVRNMDSRSGAISEASSAGALPDHIRQSATHAQLSQTADYTRNQREASDNVMQLRAAHRNRK